VHAVRAATVLAGRAAADANGAGAPGNDAPKKPRGERLAPRRGKEARHGDRGNRAVAGRGVDGRAADTQETSR
jgi:hypothetical protein